MRTHFSPNKQTSTNLISALSKCCTQAVHREALLQLSSRFYCAVFTALFLLRRLSNVTTA